MKRYVAVLAIAGLVLGGVASPAHVARGTFSYTVGFREPHLVDPPNNVCHTLAEAVPARRLTNSTDARALVFNEPDCHTFVSDLEPGETASPVMTGRSVTFL
ncbi:hypothetical protein HNR23_001606 [Nocardiopsis mwathae]|uniref:Uncharacterized protein n=1 Tax=Nocardiopsis mwathae TaxID=1472723 RepID=A0A7X0D5B2_9ACTN|nr:hypothetical protein [Nocardiopsis mwathae]MBB6171546.1 hypothetical protein [Nocardiopsis mwathae]